MIEKLCTKCHEKKPATPEFFSHDASKFDDLRPNCRACDKKYRKTRRAQARVYATKQRKNPEHKKKQAEYHKLWWKSLPDEERQKHMVRMAEWRKKHGEKLRRKQREKAYALRLKVLRHYSNGTMRCACCGESHEEFLQMDHIDGNGGKHRREIGRSKIYDWLKHNDYPEGFRVLCANCNCARGFYGYCPHDKKSRLIKGDR